MYVLLYVHGWDSISRFGRRNDVLARSLAGPRTSCSTVQYIMCLTAVNNLVELCAHIPRAEEGHFPFGLTYST